MSQQLKGLTERIVAEADKGLKQQIAAAFVPAYRLCQLGYALPIRLTDSGNKDLSVTVNVHAVLGEIEEKLFAVMVERARQDAIDGFMNQVRDLGQQVDELRNLVPAGD